ncbi:MAG: hypothetical protein V4677_05845 [Bacteroidota bacterium]
MKAPAKYFYFFLIAVTLILSSCKKDTTQAPEPEPMPSQPGFSTNNVQSLLNNLATPVETYTVNATSYHYFTAANGTAIYIYPNAFLTQAGAPVSGAVTIQVKDVLSKKDMILNNAIPVSNGQLLVSGGEVYFNATQGGQKLKMNPASAVHINVPATSPSTQMKEFYATGPANLSNTNLNWATATTTANIAVIQDTTGAGGAPFYYSFQSDSVSWSNCDYFYNIPGVKTTCNVNLTGSFDNSNSAVFLSMNGVATLVRLNSSYTAASQQFQSYLNSIPEGVAYTVVAISFDGTNYFYGSQVVTMTTDMVINLPALTQTTKSQIESNLSTLP